jgi:S-formylglutathione hydrolase
VPALIYLAGLTCNEETFMTKAGAQRLAAELGLALVAPDTSPRGAKVPGEADSWDFGVGAGFYLDATQAPWSRHYRMESYITAELLPLLALAAAGRSPHRHLRPFDGRPRRADARAQASGSFQIGLGLCAHLRAQPVPLGRKAFTGYLGSDESLWAEHDATALMNLMPAAPYPGGIRIDQGLADKFLAEQLHPELFEAACAKAGQPLALHRHAGYDHGYYFIATFMADHLRHHARQLGLVAA